MVTRSILGAIFPEAMIHYLENYGAEKFSEIFLGEFDTPEAIWNAEMRWGGRAMSFKGFKCYEIFRLNLMLSQWRFSVYRS